MFQDKEEELQRLEALLLEEEEDEQLLAEDYKDEDLSEEDPVDQVDRFYMENTIPYQVFNTDISDEDLETFSEEVWEGKPKRGFSLVALVCILATGVLLAALYLMLRYGGLL